MSKVIVASIEYDAPAEVVNAFAELGQRLDSATKELTTLKAEKDVLQTRVDSAEAEVKTIPAKVAETVKARNTLIASASKILDKATCAKMDSMEDADIKKAVIAARFPEVKLDGKDELYVATCFDLALQAKGPSAIAKQRIDSTTIQHGDAGEEDTVVMQDPRDAMIQAQKDAYKREDQK